jgi:RimJ/RimL family protein N-acetyltransferase
MPDDPWTQPVTLEGRIVRLEPLGPAHLAGLRDAAADPAIWTWMPLTAADGAAVEGWLTTALANRERGVEQPFATLDRSTGRPIGSSRYLNIVPEHRRLEIGWTWVTPGWQRRGANREAKLLMLEHAFERLGCMRVEFKTDLNNAASRGALLGIGATFEGIARNHMLMPGGRIRHSAWYSITDAEWPAVKARLTAGLEALPSAVSG